MPRRPGSLALLTPPPPSTAGSASTSSAAPPLRQLPLPQTDSGVDPVDRRRTDNRTGRPMVPRTQGTLALAWEDEDDEGAEGADHRPVPALPEPRAWIETFVRVACEIGAGLRHPGQLQRWASPEVHGALVRRHALATRLHSLDPARRATPAHVRQVVLCSVTDAVTEASSVVVDRGRVRAVALRLEVTQGRWRVTALELG